MTIAEAEIEGLEELQKYLLFLAQGGKPEQEVDGVCWNVELNTGGILDQVVDFADWEHYSDNPEYPIPHPKLEAEQAFYLTQDLWSVDIKGGVKEGDRGYIALRLEFCGWCADQVQDLIEELEDQDKADRSRGEGDE